MMHPNAAALAVKIKLKAEELRELLALAESCIDDQHQHAQATEDFEEMDRLQKADPYRWHAAAVQSLQAGIMFLIRAVEQPTGF